MSNIYIQEPPTSGKVVLTTSVGDIDVELWCRETPKACRNFIQLCMENYYDNTIFHRLVKGFIVQGGDPTGDGNGGESIYGAPFKDEFHSRLRFTRRGLLAMANSDRNDNTSQFFFTLNATPELQNKHTIFGKVAGDTLYNMLKLEDSIADQNERPMYPQKIIKTEVLTNPFEDIVPRNRIKADDDPNEMTATMKKHKSKKGVKNFGLLSFGQEAEEDEEETNEFVQKYTGKAKSTHDILNDPKLSKETLARQQQEQQTNEIQKNPNNNEDDEKQLQISLKSQNTDLNSDPSITDLEERKRIIQEKLKSNVKKSINSLNNNNNKDVKSGSETSTTVKSTKNDGSDNSSAYNSEDDSLVKRRELKQKRKVAEIRDEILSLKKEYHSDRKKQDLINKKLNSDREGTEKLTNENKASSNNDNSIVVGFLKEQQKYAHLKQSTLKKNTERTERERQTLEMLNKFKNKLATIKEIKNNELSPPPSSLSSPSSDTIPMMITDANVLKETKTKTDDKKKKSNNIDTDIDNDDWLSHTLCFADHGNILAKDASTKKDDWYDVYDPRNPLNKRKRGEGGSGGGGGGGGGGNSSSSHNKHSRHHSNQDSYNRSYNKNSSSSR